MKKIAIVYTLIFVGLFSCNEESSETGKPSVEELKEIITQKEDSLMLFQKENKIIPDTKHYDLIHALLNFYYKYPQDAYAPVCLDKVQMSYSGLGIYFKAVQFADSLIDKYPKYVNRQMVLESQASNFDIFLEPRDTNKVKHYYSILLKENPKLEKDKRAGIEMRLKHLDLNMDQYIEFLSKNIHQ